MIHGLREESLYWKGYFHLRQPLIDLMFEGVRWDEQAASEERERLRLRRMEIKGELDRLSPTIRLYPVHRRRSDGLLSLHAEQRELRAAKENTEPRSEERKAANDRIKQVQERIKALKAAGGDVFLDVRDGLSGPALARLFYGPAEAGGLAIPAFRKRRKESGKSTVTVDEVALRKIEARYGGRTLPSAMGSVRDLVLALREHRRCEKLISTYLNPEKLLSPVDGRFHSVYKVHGTQSGRLSSGSDPWGYGGNAQNLDREYKFLFLPDEDPNDPR